MTERRKRIICKIRYPIITSLNAVGRLTTQRGRAIMPRFAANGLYGPLQTMLNDMLPNIKSLFVVAALALLCACSTGDDPRWQAVAPGGLGMDQQKLEEARDFALQGGGSGYIMRSGKVVMKWGNETKRYDLKSTTKSIGISALGLAMAEYGLTLDARLADSLIELKEKTPAQTSPNWIDKISIQQSAGQTAGFGKKGHYCELLFEPGSAWAYSDCGPNWLADYLTVLFGKDLEVVLRDRLFNKIGISHDDLQWRSHAYREQQLRGITRREFGSGISANVRAMALIGELYLRRGAWEGEQLLPSEFIEQISKPDRDNAEIKVVASAKDTFYADAPRHYGLLWWNNHDGTLPDVPRDAFWSWGLYDSHILVIPSLDIVAVRAGKGWPGSRAPDNYEALKGFLNPIVAAVNHGAPYPNSPLVTGIRWAEDIFRAAEGSDNWPLTWADDDALYTAYGDGWGFDPKVSKKLSLGIAKVEGPPKAIKGSNIRSASAEKTGHGPTGEKASGLLMVDGILYMWVRNANNNGEQCQLAWSEDHGQTWAWSPWKLSGLGYCIFLNYGKNYAGAADDYVYTYSPNTASAYLPGDSIVLARVHKNNIRRLDEYQYFAGLDSRGEPKWSPAFDQRQSVFEFADGCNRLDVVYNPGIGRYLMTLRNAGQTARRSDGVEHWSLYESSRPWGPWATVFYTDQWDVVPGEALHIPSKWIEPDGKIFSLVFSGDDSFAVRKGELITR